MQNEHEDLKTGTNINTKPLSDGPDRLLSTSGSSRSSSLAYLHSFRNALSSLDSDSSLVAVGAFVYYTTLRRSYNQNRRLSLDLVSRERGSVISSLQRAVKCINTTYNWATMRIPALNDPNMTELVHTKLVVRSRRRMLGLPHLPRRHLVT
jgi:hypothetical protein